MNSQGGGKEHFYTTIKNTLRPGLILRYLKAMRMVEYYNSNPGSINKLKSKIWGNRLRKFGLQTGFSISPGTLGYGVVIPHYGTIVVGSGNSIGNYAVLHTCICITAGNKKIGNALYCSTGAKILNDIELGDGVSVGANAVVNKTVTESNVLLVGIPACIKKNEQIWYLRDGDRFAKKVEKCEALKVSMSI